MYRPHSYRYGPSAPGENYSLLIRRDSDGDEDGGGVEGDGSGGNSPLRQGARTETSVPRILLGRWLPRRNFSWMYGDSPRVFPRRRLYRRKGGVGGCQGGPDNA